jgi:hypothetical protein
MIMHIWDNFCIIDETMARSTENSLIGYAIKIEPPSTSSIKESLKEYGVNNIHVTQLVKTLPNGTIHSFGTVFEGISPQSTYINAIDNLVPMIGSHTISYESQVLPVHEAFQTGLIFPDTAHPLPEQMLTIGDPHFIARNLN